MSTSLSAFQHSHFDLEKIVKSYADQGFSGEIAVWDGDEYYARLATRALNSFKLISKLISTELDSFGTLIWK